MKRRVRATTMLLVVAILGLAAIPAARAEDEPQEGGSAAEQAYRDAWWAETSTGALDRALAGYRKAVAAEGPTAVRAKALYRSAVVLERIGKTDDAIRALEQLAEDFPDEADLQAKARDRLEEWTAVDLRTNFQEWYERYKYSPEFQGRIVELVLKLGTPGDEADAAAQQLLIIGQAAVPALSEHLDSSNRWLRGRAVDLLLQLGEFPSVRHLVGTETWHRGAHGWERVLTAPEAVRTRLLAELDDLDDSDRARLLRALLTGPSEWARAVELSPSSSMIHAMLAAEPGESVLGDLRNLVPKLDPPLGRMLANILLYGDFVPNPVALGWLQVDGARDEVARRIRDGSLRDPNAWRAIVDAMDALPVNSQAVQGLLRALPGSFSNAPASVDLKPAVLAVERFARSGRTSLHYVTTTGNPNVSLDVTAISRFLVQVVDEARDPSLAEEALKRWVDLHFEDDDASVLLIAWAQRETTPDFISRAAKYAGRLATDATLDALLDALEVGSPALAAQLAEGLRSNHRLLNLAWTDERILRLHDIARAFNDPNAINEVGQLFYVLHQAPDLLDQLTRLALQVPTRVWNGVTRSVDGSTMGLQQKPGRRAAVRAGLLEAWPRWSPEERLAALGLFHKLPWSAFTDEELAAFLRAQLAEQWAVRGDEPNEALEAQGKRLLLEVLPAITLDDVRAVFDLSDSEDAAAAAGLERLEKTAAVYDALSAARRAEQPRARWAYWSQWAFQGTADLRHRVARDLARDPWPEYRKLAIVDLGLFRDPANIPLLVEALGDSAKAVRIAAAETLAKAYDRTAIEALVKALDDPSPEVRDQVLVTLEAIKQIEEKKDYWRGFVEGKR